jgi:hypothetical protein
MKRPASSRSAAAFDVFRFWHKAKDAVAITADFFPVVVAARWQKLNASVGVFALDLCGCGHSFGKKVAFGKILRISAIILSLGRKPSRRSSIFAFLSR